jgi:hypothetical protein
MFLEGIAMIVAAVWLIRRLHRPQSNPAPVGPHPDLAYSLRMATLEYQAAANKAAMALLDIKERERQLVESRELDQLVAADALCREARAKAALIAVLRSLGYTRARLNHC